MFDTKHKATVNKFENGYMSMQGCVSAHEVFASNLGSTADLKKLDLGFYVSTGILWLHGTLKVGDSGGEI